MGTTTNQGATDVVFMHRDAVRKVAMHMARAGLSPETIRAAMADLAATEAEHAIAWAAEEDRRWEAQTENGAEFRAPLTQAEWDREVMLCGEDRRDVGDEIDAKAELAVGT